MRLLTGNPQSMQAHVAVSSTGGGNIMHGIVKCHACRRSLQPWQAHHFTIHRQSFRAIREVAREHALTLPISTVTCRNRTLTDLFPLASN